LVTTKHQEVRAWRLSTGELIASQPGHVESISAGAISPSEPTIATASYDTTVRLWPVTPLETRKLAVKPPPSDLPLRWQQTMMLSSDVRSVVTVHTNGTLSLWETTTLREIGTRPWPVPTVHSATPAADGRTVAIGGPRGELVLLDVVAGTNIAQTNFGGDRVTFLRFSLDGSRLAVHYKPAPESAYALQILDGTSLRHIRTLQSTGGSIHDAAFTPDKCYFLFGSYSSLAQLVDLSSGRIVSTFLGAQGMMIGVAITPDARIAATYATDGIIRLWDAQTGRELNRFRGAWEDYSCVALSPDGTRLAAGAEGVDIWDLVTSRQVLTLRTTNEWVLALGWSPDMTRLIGAGNQAIRVWPSDTASLALTNALLTRLREEEAAARTNAVSPFDSDWEKMMPAFDTIIARHDPDGFWRKTRATARLWSGDLQGAAQDVPAYAVPLRDPRCSPQQVDLSRFYNRLLVPDGFGSIGSDLAELKPGLVSMDGAQFDVRGVICLAGTSSATAWIPREVQAIPVGQTCLRLHFIQATGYEAADGTPVGRYILHFSDGQSHELPISYGQDVRNWWTVPNEPTNTPNAQVAWRGNCPLAASFGQSLRLWKRTYLNPRPDTKIVSLDFISAMNFPAPMLVALTLE
jgi:WD40 repeat protein